MTRPPGALRDALHFKGKPLAIKHKKSEATRLSDNLDLDFF